MQGTGNSRKKVQPGAEKKIYIHQSDPLRHEKVEQLLQQSLKLNQVLQTTLDVYDLIKCFHQEVQQFIPYHSFHYFNEKTEQGLDFGNHEQHQIHYQLALESEILGELKLTRKSAFSPQEIITFENAITNLLHPLRNAIKYHEAIIHSLTDPLTLLGNRKAYNKAIAREIEFSKRHFCQFSLLLIDVDHFKMINDNHGHQAGDDILLQLATLISQLNRNSDLIFRYGGEEFIIILSNTKQDGALFVSERLRQQIENTDFSFENKNIPLTISIGLSTFQENDNAEKIFARADKALYNAKNSGRNQVSVL